MVSEKKGNSVDVMWKYFFPAVTVVLGSYCNLKQLLDSFLVQYCIIILNMYRCALCHLCIYPPKSQSINWLSPKFCQLKNPLFCYLEILHFKNTRNNIWHEKMRFILIYSFRMHKFYEVPQKKIFNSMITVLIFIK